MKLEHVALNVSDPAGMSEWYEKYLGFEIVRRMQHHPYTHFLRDSGGRMLLEVYRNPPDMVPHYAAMDPLLLHLAFVSADPAADKERLLSAGATLVKDEHLGDGSYLVMLRDPWGLAIQFCRRAKPMLRPEGQD